MDELLRRLVALGGLLEQCVACLLVGHAARVGDDAGSGEPLVDSDRRAVALEASAVAAVARQAVDVDADMTDFGRGTLGSVDESAIVDDTEADAFAQQIIREIVAVVACRIEQILREHAGAGVLLDEHRYAECIGELIEEIECAPTLH